MSKRAGSFVTLREVIERVGRDVVRFIMLTRKNDAPLDFDFQKVSEQSKDNPVFYVQYAHARVNSLRKRALEAWPDGGFGDEALAKAELARLTHPAELALIRRVAAWPQVVESAARAHEPHRVAFYLYDVAAAFHALWNMGNDDPGLRFVQADDISLSRARLALARGVALVIASGLAVIGVTPAEEMR
jgi:arginyl-tRNA synthetase